MVVQVTTCRGLGIIAAAAPQVAQLVIYFKFPLHSEFFFRNEESFLSKFVCFHNLYWQFVLFHIRPNNVVVHLDNSVAC